MIIDYTEQEIEAVQAAVCVRYKEDVEIHLADCEVQPDRNDELRVECPALFWHARGCNFILVKMSENQFRGHFFYRPDEHYDNELLEYADPVNCATALMMAQSDHERETQGVVSGITGADLN